MKPLFAFFQQVLASCLGALMFYTSLPVPSHWPLEFRWIARWAPWVGGVVGGLLAFADWGLATLQMPVLIRSALVISLGIAITGGLHLDGVMDVADGLAVPDAGRRLEVMTDSRMGAFGGMAAIALILLKVLALSAINANRWGVLIGVAIWGRWAQQWAIARYPYLKKEGKGAFHQAALPTLWHTLPSLILMFALSGVVGWCDWMPRPLVTRLMLGGLVFSVLTGAYFYRRLGGHTGDTYGAVVEWTEALLLCSLTVQI
ncbi:MAG: adenosylcobinamide-GDP ribazoletransferase [Cyanobacteria bacterium J06632_3]